MRIKLFNTLTTFALLLITTLGFAQAPALGTSANFVLFSTVGAVTNTGISHITGNVGTNSGSSTGFGNVNGVMNDNNGVSSQCAADLLIAYGQLNTATPTYFPAPALGNGQILTPGVYSISAAATLDLDLTLNAQGNANAVFIFQIQGSLSTGALAKVKLTNGALACNVFWKVEGLVSMGTGTSMKGTIIANNAAINMSANDTLEGRAMSTSGAVLINGILAYTPIGCSSPYLTGPAAPPLASTAKYAIFSSDGPVSNSGVTKVIGDVGTNVGLTTGFVATDVTGTIHPIPDSSTAHCATDLTKVYTYLNTLPYDIQLLYPAQFGNNLVLTPHTYLLNTATQLTDTLFLNAEGNANAVFVIQINGALSTSTFAKVILVNGTQSKNVYWKVEGAVLVNDSSLFNGNIIANNGAIQFNTGAVLSGRAFSTTGAISISAMTASTPDTSSTKITIQPVSKTVCSGNSVSFTVTATGNNLTYQWRKGTVNIAGATASTYTINPATIANAATNYNVIVKGTSAPNDTSSNVSLTVNTSPVITTAPLNKVICSGSSVSFTVVASGTVLSYQWRKGTVNIAGATSSTYTINPATAANAATNYNVIVSGSCSPNDTSSNVSLTVNAAPAITGAPTNQAVCTGNSVSFAVTATGTGLTYQWRKGTVNIGGATSSTYTINPATIANAATNYNVIVSGTCTPKDTSANVSLTVNTAPVVTVAPTSKVTCSGSSVTFAVTATGSNLTYQWRKGIVNIAGATSSNYTINPATIANAANNYNVIISGACPSNDTTANVSLTVNTAPVITSAPISQVICSGNSVSFAVTAIGSNLTYQWRIGSVNIGGATSSTYTINPATVANAATTYNVIISGTCTPKDTSANVSLTVNTAPVITVAPTNKSTCSGSSVTFAVTATGTGLTYQWRMGSTNIVGATASTYTINPATIANAANNYNVIVSGTCPSNDTTANVSLTVNTTPSIITSPVSQIVCSGNAVSFTVTTTGTVTGYQWRKGTVNIVGATSSTYTINSATVANAPITITL